MEIPLNVSAQPMDRDDESIEYDPAYLNSLRELKILACFGVGSLLYTVGYSAMFGYRRPESQAEQAITLGMPSWVFWGVLLPWIFTGAVTIAFALFVMRDDDDDLIEQTEGSSGKEVSS